MAEIESLWGKYELRHTLSGPQIGSTKRDICALFVFSCADHFLSDGGSLGFVLTQSLFKSKGGGDGFRRFSYLDKDDRVLLAPKVVHDLSDFNVFEGAVNRTAVLVVEKTRKELRFPVPYRLWKPISIIDLPADEALTTILKLVRIEELNAIPSDANRPSSPWLTLAATTLAALTRVQGKNVYRAYTGTYTGGLNGAYWLREHSRHGNHVLYENLGDVGKKPVRTASAVLDPKLVYPLVRGRDLHRWHAKPSALILLPYDRGNECWISEPNLKRTSPKTYEFLLNFKPQLLQRKTAIVRQQMARGPFYAMVAVGTYTFAPWKVIYKRLSDSMQAAVVPREYIPHEKIILIPVALEQEAHYLAALINSAPSNLLLRGSAVRVQTIEYAPSDVAKLAITSFDAKNKIHVRLAKLSMKCHIAAESADFAAVYEQQKEVDAAASEYWGITDKQSRTLALALAALEAGPGTTLEAEEPEVE